MLLAIETSCDETAVALFADDNDSPRVDLISSQTKLHEPFGGVVPELAAREHLLNLPLMVNQALDQANVRVDQLSAIAVTRGPGLKGCLLVGLCYAKALAFARGIPLVPVHHIEGHLLAGELLPAAERPQFPCLALVVSGGHTMLVLMSSFRSYKVIARTRDDAAGEAFDKSATLLGLPYPGGPSLAKLAEQGDANAFRFPIGLISEDESFSFSGLKTAVSRTCQSLGAELASDRVRANLAASVQGAIVAALVRKSLAASRKFRPKSFLLTGGVAANRGLRNQLQKELERLGISFCVPDTRWCTDNAAMIGILARRTMQSDSARYDSWLQSPVAGTLGPDAPLDLGALPRWAIPEIVGPEAAEPDSVAPNRGALGSQPE